MPQQLLRPDAPPVVEIVAKSQVQSPSRNSESCPSFLSMAIGYLPVSSGPKESLITTE